MANQDSSQNIYNGLHNISFHNDSHRYYVDGERKQGVTTVMGKVLAKPGLMLWPLNMAMRHLKTKVPTITLEDLEYAYNAHIKRRDAGADTGTIVHELAERCLMGTALTAYEVSKLDAQVALSIGAFVGWRSQIKPKTIAVEQVVYSHLLDYAGTFDSILEIDGKVYLCDLKTTNAGKDAPQGIYATYFVQLGAYLYAYEEQRQYELSHGGTSLAKIDDLMIISCKKNGVVDTLTASEVGLDLEGCMKLWSSTLFLHNSLEGLERKIKGK